MAGENSIGMEKAVEELLKQGYDVYVESGVICINNGNPDFRFADFKALLSGMGYHRSCGMKCTGAAAETYMKEHGIRQDTGYCQKPD